MDTRKSRLTVSLDPDQRRKVQQVADELGLSVSWCARRALEEWLQEHEKACEPAHKGGLRRVR